MFLPREILTLAVLTEPTGTAVGLLILGALMAMSALFSRTTDRLGVPIVLLFLILGMLGGSEGLLRVPFDDFGLAARLGTTALVLILFDGGLNTSLASFRAVVAPAGLLATVGVALTAGLLGLYAWGLGLPWREAALLGAVVSSTDAAAVFAVLRGGRLNLQTRVGRTIEVESCINDPMAMILTITMIDFMSGPAQPGWEVLIQIPVQLGVGTLVGVVFGLLGRYLARHVHLPTVGLYPVATIALAFISFGAATLTYGSGFLAVFITGMMLGSASLPFHSNLSRVHDALAWLSQVGMFLMLGLLVSPSQVLDLLWIGVVLSLFLAIVARPIAVYLCILPFKFKKREQAYVSWIGLRGAVPIILGTFPVLAGVDGANQVFNLVFLIVVVSSIIPGATIRQVTRWLRVGTPARPAPSAVIEINSAQQLTSRILSFQVDPSTSVCGAHLSEIEMPAGAAVMMVVRGNDLLAARGRTRLEPGDHVYIFCRQEDRPRVELLFGQPEG